MPRTRIANWSCATAIINDTGHSAALTPNESCATPLHSRIHGDHTGPLKFGSRIDEKIDDPAARVTEIGEIAAPDGRQERAAHETLTVRPLFP